MLLHATDGLGFWYEPEGIEMEALSDDAIVLVMELNKCNSQKSINHFKKHSKLKCTSSVFGHIGKLLSGNVKH